MEKPKVSNLTDEQRKRIEQNRLQAIEKRKLAAQRTANAMPIAKPLPIIVPEAANSSASCSNWKPQRPVAPALNAVKLKPSLNLHGVFVLIDRKHFQVQMSYHSPTIQIFKTIPSRAYDMTSKTWSFGLEDHDLLHSKLRSLAPDGVTFSHLPKNIVKTFCATRAKDQFSPCDLSGLNAKLQESLMQFQKEGVYFSINNGGRVLIADDMGLGKTIQSIAVAAYYKKEWPLLVVCPSSVRYTWQEAFFTWMPDLNPYQINLVNNAKDAVDWGQVVITSYEMLSKQKVPAEKRHFQVVIIDESHFLKNYKSVRTQAVQLVVKRTNRLLLLTGTPALSRPLELFTQITMLKPGLLGSLSEYGLRYCDGRKSNWGWDYSGSSNMSELHILLQETVMVRRLKSEVMSQLPAKTRQVIVLDPTTVKVNQKLFAQFNNEMSGLKGMEQRGVLLRFFNETGATKTTSVCAYMADLLESGSKFICFAHHKIMLNSIEDLLHEKKVDFMRIDGATSSETRKKNCDRFQLQDTCRVALLSITAANAGISLTAANLVVFAELFWNPGILIQAEDRAHRIGQQDSVTIRYLVAKGTADDYLWSIIQQKLEVLSKAGLSKDDFDNLDTVRMAVNEDQTKMEDFFVKDGAAADGVSEEQMMFNELTKDIDWDEDFEDEPSIKKTCSA